MASRLRNLGVQLSVARSAGEESSTTADVVEAEAEVEAEASPRVQFFHRRRPRANFQAIWTFPGLSSMPWAGQSSLCEQMTAARSRGRVEWG